MRGQPPPCQRCHPTPGEEPPNARDAPGAAPEAARGSFIREVCGNWLTGRGGNAARPPLGAGTPVCGQRLPPGRARADGRVARDAPRQSAAEGRGRGRPRSQRRCSSPRPSRRGSPGPHRAPAPDPLTHLPANMAAPPASAERSLARPPPLRPALPARSLARSSATHAAIGRRPRRSPAQRPFQLG